MAFMRPGGPEMIAQTAAKRRFGRYKGEAEKISRRAGVLRDILMDALADAWDSFSCDVPRLARPITTNQILEYGGPEQYYSMAMDAIRGLSCSSVDVERFIILLPELQQSDLRPSIPLASIFLFDNSLTISMKTGFFLSALINSGKDLKYHIDTQNLEFAIAYLGYRNRKTVEVRGYAGSSLGWGMAAGRIIVDGNAGQYAGHNLRGGTIAINGNAGPSIGNGMSGGSIICMGDAETPLANEMHAGTIVINGRLLPTSEVGYGLSKYVVGQGMTGGEIHLEGELRETAWMKGLPIYHKGKLISG